MARQRTNTWLRRLHDATADLAASVRGPGPDADDNTRRAAATRLAAAAIAAGYDMIDDEVQAIAEMAATILDDALTFQRDSMSDNERHRSAWRSQWRRTTPTTSSNPEQMGQVRLATMVMFDRSRNVALGAGERLIAAYRRTGADVPFGDPLPSHGAEMEGWFWRVTDPASGRVIVALCGVNRHRGGDWATVAVALHPGGIVRSGVLDDARADRAHFALQAGTSAEARLTASADRLRVDLDDVHLDLRFSESFEWPKAFGGGGAFSAVPFLNQYWQPYRLGGTATGDVTFTSNGSGGERWSLDGARVYGERNWGAGFPDRWWWGQAHDFDGADVSVAFSGGVLRLGPIARPVCGVVVRLGERVIRITPPAPVRSDVTPGRWTIRARSLRYQVDLDGDGTGIEPHVLPVPLPAERRNVDTDFEHLAGRLRCVVRERGQVVFAGTSELAGLEVGSLPGRG